jgi:quinol-cytochrome oxidoreductase complex cytochrome b subunit
MNFGLFWRRLTWVLMAVWALLCFLGLFSLEDKAVPALLGFLVIGSALIFGAMRAIAWIFSGLTEGNPPD